MMLTYNQVCVVGRVEGMPLQRRSLAHPKWIDRVGGPTRNPVRPETVGASSPEYRLEPAADLTPGQAAVCMGMGVEVQELFGTFWERALSVDFGGGECFRVPPEDG